MEKGIKVKPEALRNVLRRYGMSARFKRSKYRKKQKFCDFGELYPLSHFEVDLKEIYDTKTLSKQATEHGERLRYLHTSGQM